MGELVEIYMKSLLICMIIESVIIIAGLPFAALHKFKSMPDTKSYLLDMLLINILTSPIFAFSLLAVTIALRVRGI